MGSGVRQKEGWSAPFPRQVVGKSMPRTLLDGHPPPFPLRGTTLVFPIPSRLFTTFWLHLIKQWHIWKYVFDVQFAKNLKLHGIMVRLETIRRGYVGTCPFSEELKCTFDVHVPACLLISFHEAITLSLLFFLSVLKLSHVSEKGCNIHLWWFEKFPRLKVCSKKNLYLAKKTARGHMWPDSPWWLMCHYRIFWKGSQGCDGDPVIFCYDYRHGGLYLS